MSANAIEREEQWREAVGKRCICCRQKLPNSEYLDLGGLCLV
jgi:hypothetical protein